VHHGPVNLVLGRKNGFQSEGDSQGLPGKKMAREGTAGPMALHQAVQRNDGHAAKKTKTSEQTLPM